MNDFKWTRAIEKLPKPNVTVLTWDGERGFAIGYWYDERSRPSGRQWVINGSKGAKAPEWWGHLPLSPDELHRPAKKP